MRVLASPPSLPFHGHSTMSTVVNSWDGLFCLEDENLDTFPCQTSVIVAVSVGIGAGLCALVFVLYLMRQVCDSAMEYILYI